MEDSEICIAATTRKACIAMQQKNRQWLIAALIWKASSFYGVFHWFKMKKRKCIEAQIYCDWRDGGDFGIDCLGGE